LHGAVMTKQFTAGNNGPSVELDFTEFKYTVEPDDFASFTVVCKPEAPVSIARSTLTDPGPGKAMVANGDIGACRRVNGTVQSCTRFDGRSSRTKAGALRGRVSVECARMGVVQFTGVHITSLEITGSAGTIEASGRLDGRSNATAAITATDGPTFDR